MSREYESLPNMLAKVSSLRDLRAALPPTLTSKLGEGDNGIRRTIEMLTCLRHSHPEGTISKEYFKNVVAFDSEKKQLLPLDQAERMLHTAVETGILAPVEGKVGERYRFDPQLHATMNRIMDQEK